MSYGLSAQRFTIAGGNAGIMQTVLLMKDLVQAAKMDPEIRQFTLNLVNFLPQKDHAGEAEVLFLFVQNQIRYVQDIADVETLHEPRYTLAVGQGDCDDKATLLATMLQTIGINTAFVVAGYEGRAYTHVYVLATLPDGEQVAMDATEPQGMGYEPPNPTVRKVIQ